MSRLEKNLGSLPCGHVMHFACLSTAFNSKKECPICRAAYPQQSVKIQKLFFDCSRASSALDSSHDSSFAVDAAELEEMNGRIEEKNGRIMLLEALVESEKQANRGLAVQLDHLRHEHDTKKRECDANNRRLSDLDNEYQKNRKHSIELELEAKQLRDREKRLRAQLSAFSYSKEEEKLALSKRDAPKEELVALITNLKRQNAELSLQVQKLEQDVVIQQERSGSCAQLLSNIDRGARFEAHLISSAGLNEMKVRKRARIQSAVASFVQDLASKEGAKEDEKDEFSCGGFSALKLAKQ